MVFRSMNGSRVGQIDIGDGGRDAQRGSWQFHGMVQQKAISRGVLAEVFLGGARVGAIWPVEQAMCWSLCWHPDCAPAMHDAAQLT